jgi:hypothetical protein
MRCHLIVLLLFYCLAIPVYAQQDQAILIGLGGSSCGKWLETRNSPSHYQFKQWVMGFISGINWNNQINPARPPDQAAVVAFVDHYCTNNPLHGIVHAAAVLVQESGGPKVHPGHQWKR